MIERVAGAAGSLMLAGAAASAVTQPMVQHFFGSPFEVPSMIAAIFGCVVTRVVIGQSDKVSRWAVRVPVDALAIGVTFFVVLSVQPSVLVGLVLGITIAAIGAGIIKIVEVRGRKLLDALLPGGDDAAIERAVEKLHDAAPSRVEDKTGGVS